MLTEHSPVEDDDDKEEPQQTLSSKRMAESFNMFQQAMQILIDDDPKREQVKQTLTSKSFIGFADAGVEVDNPNPLNPEPLLPNICEDEA
ncbi:hypothetical protein Hamer_G014713 [Homarus americanus]|uniref:Uncharacterized protein n=1 Tax=Homarus americanus TaxID=6706 RepID=A0A8J5N1S0_HOMAM|nr:hypothetical protein Hamer_G014713 [Homarus americanus]